MKRNFIPSALLCNLRNDNKGSQSLSDVFVFYDSKYAPKNVPGLAARVTFNSI